LTTPNITSRKQTLEFERLEFEKYLGFTALQEWLLVRRHLQIAQGFSLTVVLTPHREAAEACARDLERVLELESLNLTRVPIESPKELRQLPVWLFKHAQNNKSGAIWVDGVPPSSRVDVLERWKESWVASLSRLNEQRDAMAKRFSNPLILVAPSWLKTLMHEVAADLWSVRSLVVDVIPAPPSLLEFSNAIIESIERDIKNIGSSPDPEFALERAKRIENDPAKAEEYLILLDRAKQGFMDRRLWVDAENILRKVLELAGKPEKRGEALSDLSVVLYNQGVLSYQEAFEMSLESVKVYRSLVTKDRNNFLADLALNLNNLSNFQSNLGDRGSAFETSNEALQIYRELVSKNRNAFLPDLAMILNNHSNHQSDLGNRQSALESISESVRICRELVSKNRDIFLPELARSLNNQSNRQSSVGNLEDALETISEAVQIRRELVSKNRDVFLPELANSLNNQSAFQTALGDRRAALETISEAVKFYRELVSKNRDVYLPNLARSLNNQSTLSDRETALETNSEAVKFYRELVFKNRDAFLPDLASSLNNQGTFQSIFGLQKDALETIGETVKFYQELVTKNPSAFTPDLALSYGSQGYILNANNQFREAQVSFAEGLRLLIPFVRELPQAFVDLATKLMREYISSSTVAGREPDADLLKPFQAIYGIPEQDDQIHEILEKFEPFLQDIALVPLGDTTPRVEIEEALTSLEDGGFHISASVQRIWAGERDSNTLTNGLDAQESAIIHRILEIIQNPDQT
jgi:hypothetical protein